MTPDEHYEEAERLLAVAGESPSEYELASQTASDLRLLLSALTHATLATMPVYHWQQWEDRDGDKHFSGTST